YALENHVTRMQEDHDNARAFAAAIEDIEGLRVATPETNLVFFDVDVTMGNASQLSAKLKEHGVRINPAGPQRLRACTHLDVNRVDVLRAADVLAECVE